MIDFLNDFLRFLGGILGGFSDTKLGGVLIDFSIDFERYFTVSPKAATLDPFENFRGNRGVRHFNEVLKRC